MTTLTGGDIPTAAAVLAAAFADDPLMTVLWPTAGRRRRALPGFFATVLRHQYLPNGVVDSRCDPDGSIVAVADWLPPGVHGSFTSSLASVPGYLRTLGPSRLHVGARVRRILDDHAPETPHWYLAHIGVRPDLQNEGVGHALVQSRLEHIDSTHSAAYLVCTAENRIGFYESLGFRCLTNIELSATTTVYGMWRQPSPNSENQCRNT